MNAPRVSTVAVTGLLLCVVAVAFGQTAKVAQLSTEDAKMAKQLQDEQASLTKRMSDFQIHVVNTYLTTKDGDSDDCSAGFSGGPVKKGWNCGQFEYSDDYNFIVPRAIYPAVGTINYSCWNPAITPTTPMPSSWSLTVPNAPNGAFADPLYQYQ